MPGPAPKDPTLRRRRNLPARGDWIDLEPLDKLLLPALPEGEWSDRTRTAWRAWRNDPATAMYGPADTQAVIDLAYIYEQWVNDGTAALAAEIRQRQDALGLSPKGKQDRRWRLARGSERDQPRLAPVTRLRVTADGQTFPAA